MYYYQMLCIQRLVCPYILAAERNIILYRFFENSPYYIKRLVGTQSPLQYPWYRSLLCASNPGRMLFFATALVHACMHCHFSPALEHARVAICTAILAPSEEGYYTATKRSTASTPAIHHLIILHPTFLYQYLRYTATGILLTLEQLPIYSSLMVWLQQQTKVCKCLYIVG